MRIGAHQSIAGGLYRAIEAAQRDGCESVQIFTRNQSQWRAKPLTDEAVSSFRQAASHWQAPPDNTIVNEGQTPMTHLMQRIVQG